jgi:hypothetical protein
LNIPKQPEKLGIWQGVALHLSQAKPVSKQLNLNKLSDAGRSQRQRLTTRQKPNFLLDDQVFFIPRGIL